MNHRVLIEHLPPEISGLPAQIRITGNAEIMNKILKLIEAEAKE